MPEPREIETEPQQELISSEETIPEINNGKNEEISVSTEKETTENNHSEIKDEEIVEETEETPTEVVNNEKTPEINVEIVEEIPKINGDENKGGLTEENGENGNEEQNEDTHVEESEEIQQEEPKNEQSQEEIKNEINISEEVKKSNGIPAEIFAQNGSPRKSALSTSIDTDSVKTAYQDVRSDLSDTEWAVFKFTGPRIECSAKGSDFAEFKGQFSENDRAFGYIRIQTGDELSKRQKFLLVTWVGSSVSVLKRAKMSTDKAVIKSVVSNFAVELQLENLSEINLDNFVNELNKAGGANYGTGIRDI